jgi:uncharacterized protein with HEPN domain
MPRDSEAYLEDILEAIGKVEDYIRGARFEQLASDGKTVDAVVRNLEIIGEAARQPPEAFRKAHPEVRWRRVVGLRDILIHAYFGVDLQIVWDIVQNKLPDLRRKIDAMLRDRGGAP